MDDRDAVETAKTMTCDTHPDGVIRYRPVYSSYECHTYRDRILFTHVVGYADV